MSDSHDPLDPVVILEHSGWLRALARGLVADSHAADDLVQETWLRALRSPPSRSPRGWLATVVRHAASALRRSEKRRSGRERVAAVPETAPDPNDLVAEIEVQQRVVAIVRDLPEPYRSALLLRYFRDLTSAEIASRTGEPASTIRSRLHRALGLVRQRLDAEHGGDRQAWLALLLPVVGPVFRPGTVSKPLVLGGVIMGVKAKLSIGVAMVLLLGLTLWRSGPAAGPAPPPPLDRAEAPPEYSPEPSPPSSTMPEAGLDPETEEPTPPEGPAPEAPPAAGTVVGQVRLATGEVAAGASVFLKRFSEREDDPGIRMLTRSTEGDSEGRFHFADLPPGAYELRASFPGHAPHARNVRLGKDQGVGPVSIALTRGGTVLVTVRAADGSLRARCPVELWPRDGSLPAMVLTNDLGVARFENLEAGPHGVGVQGLDRRSVAVPPSGAVEVTLTLPEALAGLEGEILLPDGRRPGRGGAVIYLMPVTWTGQSGWMRAFCDEGGRYRARLRPGTWRVKLQVFTEFNSCVDFGEVTVGPGEARTFDLRISDSLLTGHVTKEDGGALPGPHVEVIAFRLDTREDGTVARGPALFTVLNDEGRYRFPGVERGRYELWVRPDPGASLACATRVVEVPEGGRGPEEDFVLGRRILGTARVRVLEPDGTPGTGVSIVAESTDTGRPTWEILRTSREVAPGVLELVLEEGTHELRIWRNGSCLSPGRFRVSIGSGKVAEQIVHARPSGSIALQILTAGGRPLPEVSFRVLREGVEDPAVSATPIPDRSGAYRVELGAGHCVFRVLVGDDVAAESEVEVPAHDVVDLTLILR